MAIELKWYMILADLGFIRHEFAPDISFGNNLHNWKFTLAQRSRFFYTCSRFKNNIWFARDVKELSKELGTEPF